MTPAVMAAKRAGIDFEVLEYDAGDSDEPYGMGAARALGLAPGDLVRLVDAVVARLTRRPATELSNSSRG